MARVVLEVDDVADTRLFFAQPLSLIIDITAKAATNDTDGFHDLTKLRRRFCLKPAPKSDSQAGCRQATSIGSAGQSFKV